MCSISKLDREKLPPDAHDRLLQVDVAPAKREQFPLSHSRLEGDETERPVRLVVEVREERRELRVHEICGLLPLRPRSLCRWQFANRVGVRIPIENGRLKAGAENPEMLRAR